MLCNRIAEWNGELMTKVLTLEETVKARVNRFSWLLPYYSIANFIKSGNRITKSGHCGQGFAEKRFGKRNIMQVWRTGSYGKRGLLYEG